MRTRKAIRYIADCGKGFWDKRSCLNHEERCRCWTNPKNKTCLTCSFGQNTYSLEGWNCSHEKWSEHIGGPDGVDYLSVNCTLYEVKK